MKERSTEEIVIKELLTEKLSQELDEPLEFCNGIDEKENYSEEGLSKEEWYRYMFLDIKRTFNTKISEERSFGEKVRDIRIIAFFTKKDQMKWLNIKNMHTIDEIENAVTADELSLQTLVKLYIAFDDVKKNLYEADKSIYVWGVSINEIVDELTQTIHSKLKGKEKVLRKEYSDNYDGRRIL